MTPSPSKAYIPESVHDGLVPLIRRAPGLSMADVARKVLSEYVACVEAESWECRSMEGTWFQKPAGAPYPRRQSELSVGRPLNAEVEEEPMRPVSFRLSEELYDRVYNAVWWRQDVLSHVVRAGLQQAYVNMEREYRERATLGAK